MGEAEMSFANHPFLAVLIAAVVLAVAHFLLERLRRRLESNLCPECGLPARRIGGELVCRGCKTVTPRFPPSPGDFFEMK